MPRHDVFQPASDVPPAEYCPVSIGARLIGERWTLLIVRELMTGSHRFNEIHRGLPGLSRTLLTDRLRYLERIGAVERRKGESSGHLQYHLTDAGSAMRPLIEALGLWIIDWHFPEPAEKDCDSATLLWRLSQSLDIATLPDQQICLEFSFPAADPSRGWIRVDHRGTTACIGSSEYDVDVRVTAEPQTLYAVLYGHRTWEEVSAAGSLVLDGPAHLTRQFHLWFRLSPFADRVLAMRQRTAKSWGSDDVDDRPRLVGSLFR